MVLNKQVVALAKAKRKVQAVGMMADFSVGQTVGIDQRGWEGVDCKIVKVNNTRVKLQTPKGLFNVPVGMLVVREKKETLAPLANVLTNTLNDLAREDGFFDS